jgi:hypothetical protein
MDKTDRMSSAGAWDTHYLPDSAPWPAGDNTTYLAGRDLLQHCETIEDWGCGLGWFKHISELTQVKGIDGTGNPAADVVADLLTYRSQPEGIFMRHVLEHNMGWREILRNALASFTKRMVLVLFTPWAPGNTQVQLHGRRMNSGLVVPYLSLPRQELLDMFQLPGVSYCLIEDMQTDTRYKVEHLIVLNRYQTSPEATAAIARIRKTIPGVQS